MVGLYVCSSVRKELMAMEGGREKMWLATMRRIEEVVHEWGMNQ